MPPKRSRVKAGGDDDEDDSEEETPKVAKRPRKETIDPSLLKASIIAVRPSWQTAKQGSLKQDEVTRMLQFLGYESSDLVADAQVRKYFHANKFHEVIEVDAVSSNKDIKTAINNQRPGFRRAVVAALDDAAIYHITRSLKGITREGLLALFELWRFLPPGQDRAPAAGVGAPATKKVRGVGKATSASIAQRDATAKDAIDARAAKEAKTLVYQTTNKPIQEELIEELETYEDMYQDASAEELILAGGDSERLAEEALADLKRVIAELDKIHGPELVVGTTRLSLVVRCQARMRLIARCAQFCDSPFGRDHTSSLKVQSATHLHKSAIETAAFPPLLLTPPPRKPSGQGDPSSRDLRRLQSFRMKSLKKKMTAITAIQAKEYAKFIGEGSEAQGRTPALADPEQVPLTAEELASDLDLAEQIAACSANLTALLQKQTNTRVMRAPRSDFAHATTLMFNVTPADSVQIVACTSNPAPLLHPDLAAARSIMSTLFTASHLSSHARSVPRSSKYDRHHTAAGAIVQASDGEEEDDYDENLYCGMHGTVALEHKRTASGDPSQRQKLWSGSAARASSLPPAVHPMDVNDDSDFNLYRAGNYKAPVQPPAPAKQKKTTKVASQLLDSGVRVTGVDDWVRCCLCDKWRKLPSELSAEDFGDDFECSHITWSDEYNLCGTQEEPQFLPLT